MTWTSHLWAAALLIILVVSLVARRRTTATAVSEPLTTTDDSQTLTLQIDGLRCSHCVDVAAKAMRRSPGVLSASVKLATGQAVVQGHDLDTASLIDAVESVGYRATLTDDGAGTMPSP